MRYRRHGLEAGMLVPFCNILVSMGILPTLCIDQVYVSWSGPAYMPNASPDGSCVTPTTPHCTHVKGLQMTGGALK